MSTHELILSLPAIAGISINWTPDADGGAVSDSFMSIGTAKRVVEQMRASGYRAEWVPDHDEDGAAWVYVARDEEVEVRAYVDALGGLNVELPELRGCVEVRTATEAETEESEQAADGWIMARVARHLLVRHGIEEL